ncbi:MAG: NMD3-related protein, partial [Candidatus Hydrothermarchaeales archaeon]
MRRFCSVCGKSTEVLHEGLCTQCFLKEHEFTSLPKILDTALCKRCLRQYTKGKWQKGNKELEYALNNA